jgi:subtilisin family serine protease/V8-like Glu-specific endopeptidase
VSRTNPNWLADYRAALPDLTLDDVSGSPFAVVSYTVHQDFGGDQALARLRERMRRRGLSLFLDFVPNHVAIDHPWVQMHPEFFVHGTEENLVREPLTYRRMETGRGPMVLALGRDPYLPGWPDTLQLNYRHAGLREARTEELLEVASRCDGVHCEMAMLLLPDIIARTWGDRSLPADGSAPKDSSFWAEAIPRVKARHPGFLFMAEVYWYLEMQLQQEGFDYTYDKRLYNRLQTGSAEPVRAHLRSDLQFQERSARFLENHDEPRAAAVFPPDKHRAAAVLTYLIPGLRFFHEGQLEGRRIRESLNLARRQTEPPDPAVTEFYANLLKCLKRPEARSGQWQMCECRPAGEADPTLDCFVAFTWTGEQGARLLAAVNYSPTQGQGFVRLTPDGLGGRRWVLRDLMGEARYESDGEKLAAEGLYLEMPPWGYNLFEVVPLEGTETEVAEDDRIRLAKSDSYPFRCVCLLFITAADGTRSLGTGWLAGPRTVITAGHLVYLPEAGGPVQQAEVIIPGDRDMPIRMITDQMEWVHNKRPGGDYGALFLPSPVGDQVGYLVCGALEDAELLYQRVNVVGHRHTGKSPTDLGTLGTLWQQVCLLKAVMGEELVFDAADLDFMSGAPVIHQQGEDHVVVGMLASRSPARSTALRIGDHVLNHIRDWIEPDLRDLGAIPQADRVERGPTGDDSWAVKSPRGQVRDVQVLSAFQQEKGDAALVALIVEGIDVLHETFRDERGQSRILAIWDQTDSTDSPPLVRYSLPAASYGRVHTPADIQAYISAGVVPQALGRDPGGHGTHVTSVAAGLSVGRFSGSIAPGALIIVVIAKFRVGREYTQSLGYSAGHVDALSFIEQLARERRQPVVVFAPQGMNGGAHDGTSPLEVAVDEFSDNGHEPGLVIVKSAGNERGAGTHAKLSPVSLAAESLSWESNRTDRSEDMITLWFGPSNELSFKLRDPAGNVSVLCDRDNPTVHGVFPSGNAYTLTYVRHHADNGDSRLLVLVRTGKTAQSPQESKHGDKPITSDSYVGPISSGVWSLELIYGRVTNSSAIHAWIERDNAQSIRFINHVDENHTLSIPGTARTAITVGAVESLGPPMRALPFSSAGPTRDGRKKPEIVAPGANIAGAAAGTTADVAPMSGTSMAAAHVAGAVALVLSRAAKRGDPGGIPNALQIRQALISSAQYFTGTYDPVLGYGLLDAEALFNTFEPQGSQTESDNFHRLGGDEDAPIR